MADSNLGPLEWTMHTRGIVLYRVNVPPMLVTHDELKTVIKDWAERFPEESPFEKSRVESLKSSVVLDQELARFRDMARGHLKRMLDDPELLTLVCKIIHRIQG